MSLRISSQQLATRAIRAGLPLDNAPSSFCALSASRGLGKNYTGNLITVMRSSDGTSQAFGMDSNRRLDEAAVLAFTGSGDGYCTRLWDHSGFGNHFNSAGTTVANTTGGKLVSAGVMNKFNGKPSVPFNGTSTYYGTGSTSFFRNVAGADSFMVGSHDQDTGLNGYVLFVPANLVNAGQPLVRFSISMKNASDAFSALHRRVTADASAAANSIALPTRNQLYQARAYVDYTNGKARSVLDGVNGGEVTLPSTGNSEDVNSIQPIYLGIQSTGSSQNRFKGNLSELLLFPSVLSNAGLVSQNQKQFYQTA